MKTILDILIYLLWVRLRHPLHTRARTHARMHARTHAKPQDLSYMKTCH